jgi:hypothetical protein
MYYVRAGWRHFTKFIYIFLRIFLRLTAHRAHAGHGPRRFHRYYGISEHGTGSETSSDTSTKAQKVASSAASAAPSPAAEPLLLSQDQIWWLQPKPHDGRIAEEVEDWPHDPASHPPTQPPGPVEPSEQLCSATKPLLDYSSVCRCPLAWGLWGQCSALGPEYCEAVYGKGWQTPSDRHCSAFDAI